MRKIILYIASSLDGFIARENGSIDWLKTYEGGKEDYGYNKFLDSIDTIIIGKKTYEQSLGFGEWPYKNKRCYVFTRNTNKKEDNNVEFKNDPIKFTKALLKEKGKNIWLIGGSEINSLLLNEKLIDGIILTVVPIILGKGIPLFRNMGKEVRLNLTKSKKYKSGLFQLTYKVLKK